MKKTVTKLSLKRETIVDLGRFRVSGGAPSVRNCTTTTTTTATATTTSVDTTAVTTFGTTVCTQN